MKWKWKNTGNGRSWVPQSHWPLHGMLCVYDEFVMKSLRSHDRENLSFPRTSDNTAKGLHTFKNLLDSLGWYGSVDWAQSCKLKGHLFQFPARHMPGLQARSPVAVTTSQHDHFSVISYLREAAAATQDRAGVRTEEGGTVLWVRLMAEITATRVTNPPIRTQWG